MLPTCISRPVSTIALRFIVRLDLTTPIKPPHYYTRLGSILPSIASHIFCNVMGFPDPVGAIESFPPMKGRESLDRVCRC
jgi:hypothetical protein